MFNNGGARTDSPDLAPSTLNPEPARVFDIAIVGGGIAGMATAARLQAAGLSTVVLEAHALPGGCAGYFRRAGFAFDVGATTLVDFEPGGVGGELLETIGMPRFEGEVLPGYIAWLPDRRVTLYRDSARWAAERLRCLGGTNAHRRFWSRLDAIAHAFWAASRAGVKVPMRRLSDLVHTIHALGLRHLPQLRHLTWTMGDALRAHGLERDAALRGLLGMLLEDTVHAPVDEAPLINGALGATIRGAGLTRARGGMYGFWRRFTAHYRALGGEFRGGTAVTKIDGANGRFTLDTSRGTFQARRVVSAVPVALTSRIGPPAIKEALAPHLRRNERHLGGAVVMFLGVPEHEVAAQPFTHHQLLQDYDARLGNGNNMFISVSSPGDLESAPAGHRAVMISTHCELADWEGMSREDYDARKQAVGDRLLGFARRVYPDLGHAPVVFEIATPRTFERFTRRPRGAVGGYRLTLANANQRSIPHDLGVPGFWQCGDTTWPGLGTVACVLGSRIVADLVLDSAPQREPYSASRLPRRRLHNELAETTELNLDEATTAP